MLNIFFRHVGKNYINVDISNNSTSMDLGLCDPKELAILKTELVDAIDTIDYYIEKFK